MHDARDAEDTRLLEAGEKSLLVEGYYGVVIGRSRLKVRDPERALDVAHEVVVRLMSELARGRRYRVPFRVVVHKVIEWKVKEHFQRAKAIEVELDEWLALASEGSSGELSAHERFEAFLAGLTELEQEVLTLRYVHDLDFGEIGKRLGKEPNAVHQIHHRALTKLRRRAA
jgi:RNA polymerase sigma factor (sigma-70 family)